MGSGISRGTNSTDQRTPSAPKRNRNNNSDEDSSISGRTTKRNRTNSRRNPDYTHEDTTTEVATMSRNDSLESEEDLLTLQNDLEDVERGLNERRGILFTGWSGGRSSQRGGRALFDSIGSALGNIRDRLQDLTGSGSTTPAESTNVAAISGSISSNSSRSESIQALSQRLSTAELSHSTRMPLNGHWYLEFARIFSSTLSSFVRSPGIGRSASRPSYKVTQSRCNSYYREPL